MVEGDSDAPHVIPEKPQEWNPIIILERLNRLMDIASTTPEEFYPDRKISRSALEACTFLTDPITIYNN
jgi:hypothetical protein